MKSMVFPMRELSAILSINRVHSWMHGSIRVRVVNVVCDFRRNLGFQNVVDELQRVFSVWRIIGDCQHVKTNLTTLR